MKNYISYLFAFVALAGMSLTSCSQQNKEDSTQTSQTKKGDEFSGKSIVVVTGTSEDVYARAHLKSSTLLQTSNTSDLVLNVKTGKAEIGLINYNTVVLFMKKYPDLCIINDSLYGNPIGIGFSKSRTDLRDKFNVFLEKLKESGDYEKIRKRWIDDYDNAKMPAIKNTGANGTIEFQTEGAKAPFSFMRNGNLAGLDIEIVERFAASINMKLNVSINNFTGIIEAISTGHTDMAADCIFITPERAKKIAFSDPYFICNACAFGIKKDVQTSNAGFFTELKNGIKQNFIAEKRYEMIEDGLLCTIEITVFAAILGTIIGAVICFMRMRKSKLWQNIAKAYIYLFRGIPQVVLLMILFYVVLASTSLTGITVSVIGFSLIFAAYVSEMFRTTIEGVSSGQVEAGLSMGFTSLQTFYYIVLPLTIRRVLPIYKGEIIGLIKSTSIVGYITVQDLTKVSDMIRSTTFDAFMPLILITIIYFIIIWAFSMLLNYANVRYTPKESRFI
jgi:polar amino acid transport system substrate-binding protein